MIRRCLLVAAVVACVGALPFGKKKENDDAALLKNFDPNAQLAQMLSNPDMVAEMQQMLKDPKTMEEVQSARCRMRNELLGMRSGGEV